MSKKFFLLMVIMYSFTLCGIGMANSVKNIDESLRMNIFIQNNVLGPISTELKGSNENGRIWLPVEAVRRIGGNRFIEKTDELSILFPTFRIAGDVAYRNLWKTEREYSIPYRVKEGQKEIDITNISNYLQIDYQVDSKNKKVLLSHKEGPFVRSTKKKIEGKLAMVFDPFPDALKPYQRKVVELGTSIISPSWFELTLSGVRKNHDLSVEYIQHYRSLDYRIWPLITNQFNPEMTSLILHNESQWEIYAHDLLAYALLYEFDGYNFDFENINYEDKELLTKFIAYLSMKLQAHGLYTSADVTGYSDSKQWSLVYDRHNLAKSLDYIVLMAYDQTWASSPIAGPVATYPWVKTHLERFLSEVPKEKILLGVPYYMRIWEEGTPEKKEKDNSKVKVTSKTLSMHGASAYRIKYKNRIVWDDKLKLDYVEFMENNKTYKIWFEDSRSLGWKLQLIEKYDIAGFAAWRKGFEDQETLNFIFHAIK